jgi:hypothetical protein
MDMPMLILDQRVGWTLPDLRPITDPGGMAERWRLRQVGLYTRLSGTVGDYIPRWHVFRLRERPDIWFSLAPGIVMPSYGTTVVVLAHWTPWTWTGDHLRLAACSIQRERPRPATPGDEPTDGAGHGL